MSRVLRSTTALFAALAAATLAQGARASEADASGAAEPIVVNGERLEEPDAAALKTGTPLLDTPQSVTTVSREQLDNQAISQLNNALQYVPGVILNQGEGHRDQVALRGQSTTADFYLDGLRDDAQYYRSLYNTDRIEVLKGANALLFGRGGGGGVINRVSKLPQFGQTQTSLAGGLDSFGAWSLAADVNLPLVAGAALRLNGTYERFDNHRDAYNGRFIGLAPTLGVKLGSDTDVTLSYEYADDARVTDRGIPSLGGVPIAGFDRTFFGESALSHSTNQAHLARGRIEHRFSNELSVNFTGLYGNYDKYYGNVFASGATASTVTLTGYASATQRRNWIGQGNLVWKSGTGAIRHTLLAGFEVSDQATDAQRQDALFARPVGAPTLSTIVPLARQLTLPVVTLTATNRSSSSQVTTRSGYVQDQLELGAHVQVIAGLRYDDFQITSLNRINNFAAQRSDGKWSPRIGLVLKPVANLSFYASYAKSFLPQSGDQFAVLDATTATLAPEEFRNLETGVKWDVAPTLAFTAAVYQIDRSNTRAVDPLTSNPVLTGRSRVRGYEAALTGRITPNWQASLGYAHQTGKILSTTTAAPAGRLLPQLPSDQITGWTRYDVTPKLGFGLGLVHQSSQFATISNAVRLPGFTRLDAALYYDVSDRFAVQLNVENLTDTRYFPSAFNDNNIAVGAPLNARVTARVKF